jgi:hypothetical protein
MARLLALHPEALPSSRSAPFTDSPKFEPVDTRTPLRQNAAMRSRFCMLTCLVISACSSTEPAPHDLVTADRTYPDARPDATRVDARPPVSMVALPATTPITIDGDPAEWSQSGWVTVEGVTGWMGLGTPTPPVPAPTDLSMRLAVRWEPGALYVFVDITDDVHQNTATTPENIWQGDCLQLGFDTALNKGTPYDATDDYEYGFALAGGQPVTYTWKKPTGSPDLAGSFKVIRSGQHTLYEIKLLPADLKKASFTAGMSLGFDFMVNEDDGPGRAGFLEWGFGVGIAKDPSLFGLLQLQP